MAPVIEALHKAPWARCRVLLTGQHRELVDEVLHFFDFEAHLDLDVMRLRLPLDKLAAHLRTAIARVLTSERPDLVLAQGDTTTVIAAAIASFQCGVPFGHVEAGLRTHRLFAPFPEEANRIVASHLASLHFAPTESARENLDREGIDRSRICVTGNTVIDALLTAAARKIAIGTDLDSSKRLILVTVHRRDSFGEPLRRICEAIREIHDRHPDIEFLWPVHPNPCIRPVVSDLMAKCPRIRLCEPLPYGAFVSAMKAAYLILTDSGGIQEEAPALGTPVLILRDESERPEAIEAGVARLVGRNPQRIVAEVSRVIGDDREHASMARGSSPYGDGLASRRIASMAADFLRVPRFDRAAG